MLLGLLQQLAGLSIYSQLKISGWISFIILGFLPFFGVVFFEWSVEIVLLSYFFDRIIYLFYLFLADEIHRFKASGFNVSKGLKNGFIWLVSSYMLLQFVGLIASLTGAFQQSNLRSELIQILGSLFIFYGIPWLQSVWKADSRAWQNQIQKQSIPIILLSAFTFMFAFFSGIFLRNSIEGTFLAGFFKNGYGIVIFVFVFLRFLTDAYFFTRKRYSTVSQSLE
jgi:hypothetical protein